MLNKNLKDFNSLKLEYSCDSFSEINDFEDIYHLSVKIREENKTSHESDFLTIGGMGHVSQIATGISLKYNNKKVFC